MKTAFFVAVGACLSGQVMGTIAIGRIEGFNGKTYSAAWLDNLNGNNLCNGNSGAPATWGPGCGTKFKLSNNHEYTLKGCGGNLYIENGDGSYNSPCRPASDNINGYCGIHREYICY
ncbi:hypothetical protein GE09DRAFT_1089290 [Coniochaeta sp. 2T2.1]|nr:hypothetical protein GE09DRAFT_1089290 [Coniochaeta sp. 2T2.1]